MQLQERSRQKQDSQSTTVVSATACSVPLLLLSIAMTAS